MAARILLVDDEPGILTVISSLMRANGYQPLALVDGEKARQTLTKEHFDLMISDIRMSPVDGMELLRTAHARNPKMPVIMLTAYGSQETAEEAVKIGAFDYVLKPFNLEELLTTVKRALEYKVPRRDEADIQDKLTKPEYNLQDIVAESPSMQNVCEIIRRAAANDKPVLLSGERGTGKKFLAKAIHALSPRRGKPFPAICCATLPEPLLELEMFGFVKGAFASASESKKGLFESAFEGTILLDEIGWMPQNLQRKVCTLVKERYVTRVGGNEMIPLNCRIIATTNTPVERLVSEGNVVQPLFDLLNEDPVVVAPLRERKEDVLPLAQEILARQSGEAAWTIQPEAAEKLKGYSWPSNVREMISILKQVAPQSPDRILTPELLAPFIAQESE